MTDNPWHRVDMEARIRLLETRVGALQLALQDNVCPKEVGISSAGPMYCFNDRPCPLHDRPDLYSDTHLCVGCRRIVHPDRIQLVADEYLCDDCFDNTACCEWCDKRYPLDEMEYLPEPGAWLCATCQEQAADCPECGGSGGGTDPETACTSCHGSGRRRHA